MRGLLITGTDTGVGKTRLACSIARQWVREGRDFVARKPVCTGSDEDARALAEAASQPREEVCPNIFKEPAAPPVAAACEGVQFRLYHFMRVIPRDAPCVLVEGVGGLLCPVADDATVADAAKLHRLKIVIVARRSLGTLNHTLMTLEVAKARELPVAGVVVSETEPVSGVAAHTAVDELRKRGVPILAVIAHGASDPAPAVDWWSLATG